jgi:UDP-glucose 4-epimerase
MDLSGSRIVVTGGAGFVGSHLVEQLVDVAEVTVVDDLSTGRREWVHDDADFHEGDVREPSVLEAVLDPSVNLVCHLAAGKTVDAADPRGQFEANTAATYTVLEAMDAAGVENLLYTSSSTVYGEAPRPTPEDFGPLEPISAYGAAKVAEEGLVSTYAHSHGLRAWVVRFANIVGSRLRGAVIPDFVEKLRDDPDRLRILGDGRQEKSYMHVTDCVAAMCHVVRTVDDDYSVHNLGTETTTSVTEIADTVADVMGLDPTYEYTGGDRGWTGDVPRMRLDVQKLESVGWTPRFESDAAVERAARDLVPELTEQ